MSDPILQFSVDEGNQNPKSLLIEDYRPGLPSYNLYISSTEVFMEFSQKTLQNREVHIYLVPSFGDIHTLPVDSNTAHSSN